MTTVTILRYATSRMGPFGEAATQLKRYPEPGPPTAIIDTGGGVQAVWEVEGMTVEMTERANRLLVENLGGDQPQMLDGGSQSKPRL